MDEAESTRHARGGGGTSIVVGLFHSDAGGDLNPNERRLL
jgi:hypothetical protein